MRGWLKPSITKCCYLQHILSWTTYVCKACRCEDLDAVAHSLILIALEHLECSREPEEPCSFRLTIQIFVATTGLRTRSVLTTYHPRSSTP
jgi:hypothetical protein